MKIATLTLNPCIDKTLYVSDAFQTGSLNRASSSVCCAGGKGINVSRLQKKLGAETEVFGFSGGAVGEMLQEYLQSEQIFGSFTKTACETRMCIKIIDDFGDCTEINEGGGPIREDEWNTLLSQLSDFRRECEGEDGILVCAGSIPRGLSKSAYSEVCQMLLGSRVRVVLDADGDALRHGLEGRPWLIKPNIHELTAYFGKRIACEDTRSLAEYAASAGKEIFQSFGTRVICTMGGAGAVYVSGEDAIFVNAPKVLLRSFAGAGDTFLSAFLYAHFMENQVDEDAMRFASAAAAAKVAGETSSLPEKEDIVRYLDMVHAVRLHP